MELMESTVRRVAEEQLGAVAALEPVGEHLGTRTFLRVRLAAGGSVIARVETSEDPKGRPAGVAPEPPLEPIRSFLEDAGLPVPARLGGEGAVELLEDLGARSLGVAAAQASATERRALYAEACDLVPRLQRLADPGRLAAFERRLDEALIRYKADLFGEWSFGDDASKQIVRDAFARIAGELASAPLRLSHRDLQSSNLLVRANRDAGARLAMIDLQGAFLAPPEYDLVCLLRDSYVELPEDEIEEQLARIRPELPDAPDAERFARRFDLLTLTRKGKDHARFVYAARARGDHDALRHLPVTVRHLRGAAERSAARDAAFAPLARLIETLSETLDENPGETPCAP